MKPGGRCESYDADSVQRHTSKHEDPSRHPVAEEHDDDCAAKRAYPIAVNSNPGPVAPTSRMSRRDTRQKGGKGYDEQRGQHHDEKAGANGLVVPTKIPAVDDALAQGNLMSEVTAKTGRRTH